MSLKLFISDLIDRFYCRKRLTVVKTVISENMSTEFNMRLHDLMQSNFEDYCRVFDKTNIQYKVKTKLIFS